MRKIVRDIKLGSLLIVILFTSFSAFSQNKYNKTANNLPWKIIPFERKAFIENKGQFDNLLPEDKKGFQYCIDKGQQVFFYNDGIRYRFNSYTKSKVPLFSFFESEEEREERVRKIKNTTEYIFVKWLNSNPNAIIIPQDKQTTHYSYIVNNENNRLQTLFCDGYSKLIYKDLYPGIDIEYIFHPDNGIKYNLLIHPGADLSLVKMQYDKNVKIINKNGDIQIKTIAGDIIDHAPVTFYSENHEKIGSSFKISENTVSFDIPFYEKNKELIIDPWLLVPGFTPAQAYDNGVDNAGNIYIYGGQQGGYTVEKYPSSGGAVIWSLSNSGIDQSYYGDMLVEGNGSFYLCEGFVSNGARTYKYSSTSSLIWQSSYDGNFREHWRLALNCVTNKVIVAGGGTTSPTLNIAEIDVNTGTLVNAKSVYNQSQSDVAGLCVDEFGKAYLKHSNPNILTFTDSQNNTITNIGDGYNLSEIGISTPTYYPGWSANGYNFMTLGGTSFLFTSDGATIKKWDMNTQALISSAVIPGGQQNLGSGILADKCNNLFVGASNGVYRFDFNLIQKEFQPTTTAVYDIAYAINSDIVASGDGFLQTLPFGREACGEADIQITSDPCDPELNTVKVTPTLGIPPFSFFWDDGNTDSVRTNLTLGNHVVSIKDGACSPSFYTDTIKITNNSNAISVQKTNPLCALDNNGDITITLLGNQQITGITWTPSVSNALLNDSTSKATGLTSGTYNCFVTSSLGCSFDTVISLSDQFPKPTADFADAQACIGDTIPFADNSTNAGATINAWSWNYGDNNPLSILQNPNHAYSNYGTYTVELIVTTSDGCKDTTTKNIYIHPLPTTNFSFGNVCEGSVVFLNNASTISPPDIIQFWAWDFGDGGPLKNNQNTSHLYSLTGTYNTQLTVTSNFGCSDSITKIITINPNPVVNFTAPDTNGCSPLCVNFQSTVSGNITSYVWNYGEPGATGNSADGYYCYSNNTGSTPTPTALNFDIILTATTDSGCVSTLTKSNYIIVYPNPIANFNAEPQTVSVMNPGITIKNLSMGATVWNWDFGDSTTSTDATPAPHEYADTGSYIIMLAVANQYGCTDSTYRTITIEPEWSFFVPNAFTPDRDGINDCFQGYGYGLLEYKMTIFDRWGNKIYETKHYDEPWDGRANGGNAIAQKDVYIYQFSIKDIKGRTHTYTGTVTLVR